MTDAELAEIEKNLGPFRDEENGDGRGEPEWQATISMREARCLVAEVRRLQPIAAAARELVIWDWLHLLCDGEHADVVRDDVDALGMALAKYDMEKKP